MPLKGYMGDKEVNGAVRMKDTDTVYKISLAESVLMWNGGVLVVFGASIHGVCELHFSCLVSD